MGLGEWVGEGDGLGGVRWGWEGDGLGMETGWGKETG